MTSTGADDPFTAGLRAGDLDALAALIRRDHAVAAFLADAVAAGPPVEPPVRRAWQRLVTDVRAGEVADHLRAELARRVVDVLDEDELLDTAEVEPPPSVESAYGLLPPGDRWAGWWADEPPTWPDGARPDGADLLHALRRLPVGWRALVVLRDVAGLTGAEVEPIVARPPEQQDAVLDDARAALLVVLDEQLGAR